MKRYTDLTTLIRNSTNDEFLQKAPLIIQYEDINSIDTLEYTALFYANSKKKIIILQHILN